MAIKYVGKTAAIQACPPLPRAAAGIVVNVTSAMAHFASLAAVGYNISALASESRYRLAFAFDCTILKRAFLSGKVSRAQWDIRELLVHKAWVENHPWHLEIGLNLMTTERPFEDSFVVDTRTTNQAKKREDLPFVGWNDFFAKACRCHHL
ncbi:MAG: hypothetical protein M1821_000740 [Bathelium mastoideum]|nr:MAG: hypothetical protein M1821_000740 [Bathelium mastoideum]KAI9675981.1 MAG: hypothetical protein M1822_008367 [Bathelium mastoideum]